MDQEPNQPWQSNQRKPHPVEFNRHESGNICRHCGALNHWTRECPIYKIEEQLKRLTVRLQDLRSCASFDQAQSLCGLQNWWLRVDPSISSKSSNALGQALSVQTAAHIQTWCLDSGATSCVTGSAQLPETLEPKPLTRTVRSAGGQHHHIHGMGRASISTHGPNKYIDNVWNVPSVVDSLLSVGRICDSSFIHVFA